MTCVLATVLMTVNVVVEGSSVTRVDRVKFARKWMDEAKARGGLDASEGVDVGDAGEGGGDDAFDGFASGDGRLGLRVGSTPVEKMEAYVRVRWNETIHPSSYDAREHPLGAALAALRSEHGKDEKTALVLCLIYERFERREESAFMDYFRAMPEEFDTPTFWSDASAKELRGSDTYEKDIVDEFKLINKMWGGLRRRVFDVYTDVFTQSSSKSLYALRWAWAVVHSRAVRVSGKEGLALVPVLDMIRECGVSSGGVGDGDDKDDDDDDDASGEDAEAEDAGFAVYDKHADEVVVYAKRDYRPNEDICERFGSWNNGESLQHFGYLPDVDEDDMRNCVLMILEPEKRYSDTILKAGFDVPWRVCVPRSPTQASLDLFAAYAELAEGRRVDIDESGVPRNVSRVGALNLINERLTRYPTTIDQDEYALRVMRESHDEFSKSIRDGSLALLERARLEAKMHEVRRSALAIELRFREKKILKTLADRISYSTVDAGSGSDDVKDEL